MKELLLIGVLIIVVVVGLVSTTQSGGGFGFSGLNWQEIETPNGTYMCIKPTGSYGGVWCERIEE